jgi:hypothetical protein
MIYYNLGVFYGSIQEYVKHEFENALALDSALKHAVGRIQILGKKENGKSNS